MTRATFLTLLLVVWASGMMAQGRDQVARSEKGMVVAAQPLATLAGLRIFEQGGNAADAAFGPGR